MKTIIKMFPLWLLILFSFTSASIINALEKNSEIKTGDYLQADYIDTIEKTHSPSSAVSSSTKPQLLMVQKGEYDLIMVYDFHEFHDGLNVTKDRKSYKAVSDSKSSLAVKITIEGDNLFLTGYDANKPLHFIYVNDAQRYIAAKVIAGDYTDSEGKSYYFREDGTASFGENQFRYEMGLDFVIRPNSGKTGKKRDYFRNSESSEIFEYEIIDGMMLIYRTGGQESLDVEKEPFLKIKKVSKID